MLRFGRLAPRLRFLVVTRIDVVRLEALRRKVVGRGEHRPAAQFADAGVMQHRLLAPDAFGVALALGGLEPQPALFRIRVIQARHRAVQAVPIGFGQLVEQAAVGDDRVQQVQRGAHALLQRHPPAGLVGGLRRCIVHGARVGFV